MKKFLFLAVCLLFLTTGLFADGIRKIESGSGSGQLEVNEFSAGKIINQQHDEFEVGNGYRAWYHWADVDTPQGVTLTVVVPTNMTIHARMGIEPASQNFTWNLWKNHTATDNAGTTLTTKGNAYITHSNTSDVMWYIDGNNTGGTVSGIGGHLTAGKNYADDHNDAEEIIIGPGIHSWYFEPVADNASLSLNWLWYEPY